MILLLCASSALAIPCTVPKDPQLNIDDATNVQAVTYYQAAIADMLVQEQFAQLDCLADSLRANKERFSGGMWKLHALYSGLSLPLQHPTEPDWKNQLATLTTWVSMKPNSVTARIALAQTYLNYGWFARGTETSDTVSETGWQLFAERSAKARAILEEAAALKIKCPEWYVVMMSVALAEGWKRPQAEELVDQAFALDHDYYYVYRLYANYLLPKWYGEDGETEKFVAELSDRIGGKSGDAVYFQIAGFLVCSCNDNPQLKRMSWQRIQNGFAAVTDANGSSLTNMNMLALMAMKIEDYPLADQMFKRIADQWSEATWHKQSYYDSMKDLAAQIAPIMLEHRQGMEEADTNSKSPEGARYQAAFEKQFASIIQQCTSSAPSDSETFDLVIKIDEKGTPSIFMATRGTAVSSCLVSNLMSFHLAQTAFFPPPPRPSYWLRLPLNPSAYPPKNLGLHESPIEQGQSR